MSSEIRIRPVEQIRHLQRIRDRLLTTSPQGAAYIELFERHSNELTSLFVEHRDILELVDRIVPRVLAQFPAQNPGSGRLSQDVAEDVLSLMDKISKVASPGLALASTSLNDEVRAFVGRPAGEVLEESWKLVSGGGESGTPTKR